MTEKASFDDVSNDFLLPKIEENIIDYWNNNDIFAKTLIDRKESEIFTFYEGPPTANGTPGIHHVLARVIKDLILRYKTMQGFKVERKGGWDTHGLPVELEVEKKLGLTNKNDIEKYGIEEFNKQCKESVFNYVQDWEKLTNRIGYWIDMDNPYITYENNYIESGWWIFQQLWENKLIFRDFRVTPQCGRCETSLSSHEIALGYKEDTIDPSVYVKFNINLKQNHKLIKKITPISNKVSIMAWTTTPWTLPGNTALAIDSNANYIVAAIEGNKSSECIIIAENLLEKIVSITKIDLEKKLLIKGSELIDLTYEHFFDVEKWEENTIFQINENSKNTNNKSSLPKIIRKIVAAEFVGTDEGTGIVHIAPAFGDDDYKLGQDKKLFFVQHINSKGRFYGGQYKNMFIKDADKEIIKDLKNKNVLHFDNTIKHTYPFCWRCDDPIIYYAKPSWYIKTTEIKDILIQGNQEKINWVPEHIKSGRFGEWLEGNIDWAFSRERYWGTPLPFWECDSCSDIICIGSFQELKKLANMKKEIEDPHRPYIDEIYITCKNCGSNMKRVSEVADAWFDSGAMPYAQWHYPFENKEVFEKNFPADFITEGMDQTRGWFYTLHALATLLFSIKAVPEQIAFKNCISHGIILDGNGQKMSKSKGNVVEPFEVIDKHGADAIRWYMLTSSPPGNTRRFSSTLVEESSRKTFTTLWNVYSFFVTYANLSNFSIQEKLLASDQRTELDIWIQSELNETIKKVTEGLEKYEPSEAARPINQFIEQLSNWYVRRSRRRFWKTDNSTDSLIALNILYHCLIKITQISAPFIPFLSEEIYRNLIQISNKNSYESIHLSEWPQYNEKEIDANLSEKIKLIQKMISMGRRTRQQSSIKIRQPLEEITFIPKNNKEKKFLIEANKEIKEELNVKNVEFNEFDSELIQYTIKINKATMGPKIGKEVNKLENAIANENVIEILKTLNKGEVYKLLGYDLEFKDLNIKVKGVSGYAAAEESGYIAILKTAITKELALEGAAREIIRHIQDRRQKMNFDVSDRISIQFMKNQLMEDVLEKYSKFIANETLAISISEEDGKNNLEKFNFQVDNIDIELSIEKQSVD
ncbi:MAG: isoleucine--tRNA ligase [Chloroflexi bacterium]|nr:isoleucine--tRNA ligase [Chloroflexota bacterium]